MYAFKCVWINVCVCALKRNRDISLKSHYWWECQTCCSLIRLKPLIRFHSLNHSSAQKTKPTHTEMHDMHLNHITPFYLMHVLTNISYITVWGSYFYFNIYDMYIYISIIRVKITLLVILCYLLQIHTNNKFKFLFVRHQTNLEVLSKDKKTWSNSAKNKQTGNI